jgi:deazaflavin-dependent oxidoreductase (nitroreductase family)
MFASDPDGDQIFDNPTGWVGTHIRRYVESGGARGHRFYGHDALLLTTRGRATGRLRRTPLYYGRDGDRYVLVASDGGARSDPDWYRNLLANPVVGVQVKAEQFAATARPATPEERPRLWELMTAIFPTFARYEKKAGRALPVVVLEAPATEPERPRRRAHGHARAPRDRAGGSARASSRRRPPGARSPRGT